PLQGDALLRLGRPEVEGLVDDLTRAGANVLHELVWYRDRRHVQRHMTDLRPMALACASAHSEHEQDGPLDDCENILLGGRDPAIVKGNPGKAREDASIGVPLEVDVYP